MPTRTSAQSGLSDATSSWVGGVVPVVGDDVVIAAGHTITLRGTQHWGNDTATAITVNGVLRASRTENSQLTCRGDLFINTGGSYDYGTEVDPIPANVTHSIIINESATMAHTKWGIRTLDSGAGFAGFRMWGASKQPSTTLVDPVLAASTVIRVANATGWQVGDWLGFQPVSGTTIVYRSITGISTVSGTVADITLSGSLGRDGAVGNGVLNLTRNVKIIPHLGQTWRACVSIRVSGTHAPVDAIEIGPCEIRATGGSSSTWQNSGLNIHPQSNGLTTKYVKAIDGPVITAVQSIEGTTVQYSSGNGIQLFAGQGSPYTVRSVFIGWTSNAGSGVALQNGVSVDIGTDSVILGASAGVSVGYSHGSVASTYRGKIWGSVNFLQGSGVTVDFDGAVLEAGTILFSTIAGGMLRFRNCQIGLNSGQSNLLDSVRFQTASLWPVVMENCNLSDRFGVSRTLSVANLMHPSNYFDVLQKNGNPALNERFVRGGRISRDSTVTRRSTGSVCLASWYSANNITIPLTSRVAAGATLRVKGSVWIEASYLPGSAPTVSLRGQNLFEVLWTAATTADTWQDFDLQIVNTNSYPIDITITLTARSDANTETARVWFDGIFADPWTGSVRHFGFQWKSQTALEVDPRITLTEAAALALPVVIDHVAQTITVLGTVTARQVFEAAIADLVQPANQSRAVHIASATGESFETTYEVITSGAGRIVGAYEDSSGRHVMFTAPALIAGSRVQLYDLTAAVELYNGVLSTSGFSIPLIAEGSHNLRLRAAHSTKKPMEDVVVLTESGGSSLKTQDEAVIYMANNIDGSTCTEFSADGPNVEVDLNSISGVTSVQRLYAWAHWYETTQEGIAREFFGALEAIDSATYIIDQDKADIKLDNVRTTPVQVVGAYLARKDGTTVIASGSGSIQMDPGKAYLADTEKLAKETTLQAVMALALMRRLESTGAATPPQIPADAVTIFGQTVTVDGYPITIT